MTVADLMVQLSNCPPQSKIRFFLNGKTYEDFSVFDLWDMKKVEFEIKDKDYKGSMSFIDRKEF